MSSLKDVRVTMPERAVLTCEIAPGDPPAAVRWYKDAKEVYASRKYDMSYSVRLRKKAAVFSFQIFCTELSLQHHRMFPLKLIIETGSCVKA